MALLILLVSLSSLGRVHAEEVTPDFTLIDIDDNEFSLADFRGTTVVLTFVATRIITCKTQVFILNNISRYFGDEVVIVLIGINNETLWVGGDTEEQLQQFRDDCGFEGIVARDTEGVTDDYSVTYIPATFIIDQAGYIRYKHFGVVQTGESVLLEELQVIVPEFSATAILLFIIVTSILAVFVSARRHRGQDNLPNVK